METTKFEEGKRNSKTICEYQFNNSDDVMRSYGKIVLQCFTT